MFPDGSVEAASNYCRNPDNEPVGLWCYTMDPDKRWEECDVPICGQSLRHVNYQLNHGLRGSASPVLTATGFVNGRGQFSTPTESTPMDRSPKNLLLVIMSATPTAVPNLVQIRPRGASGQMGK